MADVLADYNQMKDTIASIDQRLSDAFSDIEDAAISSMTYQAEHGPG